MDQPAEDTLVTGKIKNFLTGRSGSTFEIASEAIVGFTK